MFDSEDWNVDSKATSLDSSLFGPVTPKSNKRKKVKVDGGPTDAKQKVTLKRKALCEDDADKQDGKKSKKGLTDKSNIPVNDSQTDKLKDKNKKSDLKKMKQKERRKQKLKNMKNLSGKQENKKIEKDADGEKTSPENEKKKTRKDKTINSEISGSVETEAHKSKPDTSELGEEKKLSIAEKKRRKRRKEKERKKRKMLNLSENSSPKKSKVEDSSPETKTGQMSRKERRNKRKKNNSKKNKFANLSQPKKDLSNVDQSANEKGENPNVAVLNKKKANVKKQTDNEGNKTQNISNSNQLNKEEKGKMSGDTSKKKSKSKKCKLVASTDSTDQSPQGGDKSKNKFTQFQENDSSHTPNKQGFDLTKLKEVMSSSAKKIKVIEDELEKRSQKHLQMSDEDELKKDENQKTKTSKKKKGSKGKTTSEDMKLKVEGMESQKQGKSLKERMQDQLNAAWFRYLNEQLYTTTGAEAVELFAEDDEAFHVYHQGYQTQVSKWPVDPLNIIIKQIKARHKPAKTVIADMGCGSARLAESLPGFKVHSFDFVAANERVTACDMSHVPLNDGSVDVVVFCLSLMGTNLVEYILEANRILKLGGVMKVAEVESRFKKVGSFVSKVEKLGFEIVIKDLTNKMFYLFDFKKDADVKLSASNPKIELDPCIYKKR